jgi:hypothetical protein
MGFIWSPKPQFGGLLLLHFERPTLVEAGERPIAGMFTVAANGKNNGCAKEPETTEAASEKATMA